MSSLKSYYRNKQLGAPPTPEMETPPSQVAWEALQAEREQHQQEISELLREQYPAPRHPIGEILDLDKPPASNGNAMPQEHPIQYQAPPSRDPGGIGGYREPHPSRVQLSRDELEIARVSGLSPQEYAAQKLRMLKDQRLRPGDYPRG